MSDTWGPGMCQVLDLKRGLTTKQALLLQLWYCSLPFRPPSILRPLSSHTPGQHAPGAGACLPRKRSDVCLAAGERGRSEGARGAQMQIVVEAEADEFVVTKRLEEELGGATWCTWRNILGGYYRSSSTPARPRAYMS
jgi:hypothetical protein